MVAHTARGGFGDIYGYGMDAEEAGSEGGNYGYADGQVVWHGTGSLTVVATFFREGPAMRWHLLPDGAW